MNTDLTIVIPCKNEGRGIVDIIRLVREQVDCRVIVADSSDDEGSILLLRDYVSVNSNMEIIKGGLPAIARNNGAKLVTTPYVLFLDADVYIYDPLLLLDCLSIIKQKNYDLLTCKFKTCKPYRWVFRIFDIVQYISSITRPFAVGGFMLFNTEVFRKLGGFDVEVKVAEDYLLSSKIKPRKFKVVSRYVYTPSRRFEKKGVLYMIGLMWRSWLNRNNSEFFKYDQNYWNET